MTLVLAEARTAAALREALFAGRTVLHVKTGERLEAVELSFEAVNALTTPGEHAMMTFSAGVGGGSSSLGRIRGGASVVWLVVCAGTAGGRGRVRRGRRR